MRGWRRPATRALAWQVLALALLAAALLWLGHNLLANMRLRGIPAGWDFLASPAGFDIGEQLLHFESGDPYWRALLVGVLNTLRVALAGIVTATLLGAAVGIARFSPNALLRGLSRAFVELFRNVPLLVQLLVWYLVLVELLPEPGAALQLPGGVLLSKAGLAFPFFGAGEGGWHWSVPRAEGFGIEGGAVLTPEFLAVWLGLSVYTAAFIAEVVRAGIAAVPAGQLEAALSVGLSRGQALRRVQIPQALRVIVPPLTNQYLNLTKNSSLAVAVGYPELVSVANTALNQTGRALECIALIMLVYAVLSLLTAALMGALNRRVAIRER